MTLLAPPHEHILLHKNIDQFDDIGPCVIMASPGFMNSGLSRQLFEAWCTDKRNGVIIAGYCVEGTLAKVSHQEGTHTHTHTHTHTRIVGWKMITHTLLVYLQWSTLFVYTLCLYIHCTCIGPFHVEIQNLIFILTQHVLSEPSEIVTLSGQKLPLRMSVGMCTLCIALWADKMNMLKNLT